MKKSQFQFSNPMLINSIFQINRGYEGEDIEYEDIPVSFHGDIIKHENNREAIVELKVK